MEEKIKLVGEREIDKETKHFKISHKITDILLPMMLDSIDNASKLDEEDFYLLDCLVKCELLFCNIDVQEDYSENVTNLLKYCREKIENKSTNNSLDSYTYVYLTNNNIDTLIKWLLGKIESSKQLSAIEETLLEDLVSTKNKFYKEKLDNDIINIMREVERIKILVSNEEKKC